MTTTIPSNASVAESAAGRPSLPQQTSPSTRPPHYAPMREVRKALRVKWYRTPIEKPRLWELMERSDRRAFQQTLGHIGVAVGLGAAAAYFFTQEQWALFGVFLWLFGTVRTFLSGPASHELGHGTAFRTQFFNRFFVRILGVLTFWNYNEYRMSHTYHHRYTLHPDADREELLPRNPSLHPLLLLEMLTVNVRGGCRQLQGVWRTARGRFDMSMVSGAMGSTSWGETLADIHPDTYRAAVRLARIQLLFHGAVIAVSIAFGIYWLAIVVTGANFVGNGYRYLLSSTQHAGLRDNVPDFRLCVRTLKVDPITSFFYWHMTNHTEHHMYAGVPGYNLKALGKEIAWDLPEPRSVWGAWREMYRIRGRQKSEPDYQFETPLPPTANPPVTSQDDVPAVAAGAAQLAASIGTMDPDEDDEPGAA